MKLIATLCLVSILALSVAACAGNMDLTPGAEAYVDSGGRNVAAIGVRGPNLKINSEGLYLGPNGKAIREGGEGVAEGGKAANDGLTRLAWAVGVLGGLILAAAWVMSKKKKD